jgi:hypothetical protein
MQEKRKRCTWGGCGIALIFLLVCVGLIVVVYLSGAEEDLELQVFVKEGALWGHHLTTRKGQHILAFQGIPYAKPPVGDLRFRVCILYMIPLRLIPVVPPCERALLILRHSNSISGVPQNRPWLPPFNHFFHRTLQCWHALRMKEMQIKRWP